ncbi:MAG: hypothetical protein ACRC92_10555 [Peptostreptococcaceae bacterium]
MHKLKNKKLLSLCLAGLIAIVSVGTQYIYAEDEISNNEQEIVTQEVKTIAVNDINNAENLDCNVKTQGTITKIDGSIIYIRDDSGEGAVFLESIVVENIKVGDVIEVAGIITAKESQNVILVNSESDLTIISASEEDTEVPDEETEIPDDSITNPEGENNTNKPSSSNKPSGSMSGGSGSNSSQGSSSQSNNSSEEVIVSNNVKGKEPITVSTDLTEAEWNKVKSALEDGEIKVKDLPNNKIRITKVSLEKGDTIWIVNDPRMLDSEDEVVNIVNSKSIVTINSVNYEDYDVTEAKWSTIVNDIIDGYAKIKILDSDDLKIIYAESSGEDSTITIAKN